MRGSLSDVEFFSSKEYLISRWNLFSFVTLILELVGILRRYCEHFHLCKWREGTRVGNSSLDHNNVNVRRREKREDCVKSLLAHQSFNFFFLLLPYFPFSGIFSLLRAQSNNIDSRRHEKCYQNRKKM